VVSDVNFDLADWNVRLLCLDSHKHLVQSMGVAGDSCASRTVLACHNHAWTEKFADACNSKAYRSHGTVTARPLGSLAIVVSYGDGFLETKQACSVSSCNFTTGVANYRCWHHSKSFELPVENKL
jgi:hypothetical protein